MPGLSDPALVEALKMRRLVCYLLVMLSAGPATAALAQAPPQQAESAAALFRAVDGYVRERRAEMRAQGKAPDREDIEKLEREQKDLAAKSAAKLAARADLAGMDFYFLGSLYSYADKRREAVEAMRRFLSDKAAAKGVAAQYARNVVAVYGAQNKMLEEAEAARLEYLANEPKAKHQLVQNEFELGLAYLKAKQHERALERATEAFRLAKTLTAKDIPQQQQRERVIFNTGEGLVEAYNASKKKEEALATVVDLFQLALDMPSASLYRVTASRFPDKADDAERAIVARASDRRATPPELTVAEWLDGEPLKLSDLRGQVVLIDFWYEWCGPCLRAFPTLRDWHKKYKDKGFVVIGLTDLQRTLDGAKSRAEKMEFLRRFRAGNKLTYPIAVAESAGDNLPEYGVSSFPTAVLIDRRGAVRYISIGVSPSEMSRLGEMVEKLVKEAAQ